MKFRSAIIPAILALSASIAFGSEGIELGNGKCREYRNALIGISTYYPVDWDFAENFGNSVRFSEAVESEDSGVVEISTESLPEVHFVEQLGQYLSETYTEDNWVPTVFNAKEGFKAVRKTIDMLVLLRSDGQSVSIRYRNHVTSETTKKQIQSIISQISWSAQ